MQHIDYKVVIPAGDAGKTIVKLSSPGDVRAVVHCQNIVLVIHGLTNNSRWDASAELPMGRPAFILLDCEQLCEREYFASDKDVLLRYGLA